MISVITFIVLFQSGEAFTVEGNTHTHTHTHTHIHTHRNQFLLVDWLTINTTIDWFLYDGNFGV